MIKVFSNIFFRKNITLKKKSLIMSLNELILDKPKPWLNARVNDLIVDGDLTVSGVTFEKITVSAVIPGVASEPASFATNDIPFNIELDITGSRVTMKIPPISIIPSNQEATGEFYIEFTFPSGYAPNVDCSFPLFISLPNTVSESLTQIQYDTGTSRFQIRSAINTFTFVQDVNSAETYRDQFITWIV